MLRDRYKTMTRGQKSVVAAALAAAVIAPFEGLRQQAYMDPVGIPTICFGATAGVRMGQTASLAECKAKLDADINIALSQVQRCAPGLDVYQAAAFASAVYNIGPKIVCGPSTAARLIQAGQHAKACDELPKWNKARVPGLGLVELPGLTTRREAERQLCHGQIS
jgi:GH24 family phage-related lysozyme (muramidase)